MGYFRKVFREPSTYAGFAGLSMVLGQLAGPEAMALAVGGPWVALAGALAAVFLPERGGK